MTRYKMLSACMTFMLVSSFCTWSARADTMTLLILIQLERSVDAAAVVSKVRSTSLSNCLVANAVSLGSDQVLARIQCDDLLRDAGSKALADIGRLENVKQATTFSVSKP